MEGFDRAEMSMTGQLRNAYSDDGYDSNGFNPWGLDREKYNTAGLAGLASTGKAETPEATTFMDMMPKATMKKASTSTAGMSRATMTPDTTLSTETVRINSVLGTP